MVLPASLTDRFSLDAMTADCRSSAVIAIHNNGLRLWLVPSPDQGGRRRASRDIESA